MSQRFEAFGAMALLSPGWPCFIRLCGQPGVTDGPLVLLRHSLVFLSSHLWEAELGNHLDSKDLSSGRDGPRMDGQCDTI